MRKTIVHIIGILLFVSSYTAIAQTIKTNKWEPIDIPFSVKADIPNPFELELSCTFTREWSETLTVPGFYNGKRQWVVRFTPNSTGVWTCLSHSSDKRMDGKQLSIEVSENHPDNPGAIQINENNPRLFSYENWSFCHFGARDDSFE